MPFRARLFIAVTAAVGLAVSVPSFVHCHSEDPGRFFSYLLIAVLASRLKVRLPGIDGTMSVNFLFVLLGVMEMSLAETLLIGFAAGLAQCLWTPRQSNRLAKIVFNVFGMMGNAVAASYWAYHGLEHFLGHKIPLQLAVAATAYSLPNTLLITTIGLCPER